MRAFPSFLTPTSGGRRAAAMAVVVALTAGLGAGFSLLGVAAPASAAVAQVEAAPATDAPTQTAPTSETVTTPAVEQAPAPVASPSASPSASPAPTSTAAPTTGSALNRAVSRMAAAPSMSLMAVGAPPEAPRTVWFESFGTGPQLVSLQDYGSYAASLYWIDYAKCNGVILSYDTTQFGNRCTSASTENQNNARWNVRRMADVLGQVNENVMGSTNAASPVNASTASTRANRAIAEWTDVNPSAEQSNAGNLVIGRTGPVNITGVTDSRYYVASLDVAEASCGNNNFSRLTLTLANNSGGSVTGAPISACNDSRAMFFTSDYIPGSNNSWGFGGASVRAGRFGSDSALLVPADQVNNLRPSVNNLNNTGGGNDFAIDNLRIVDVTPRLDMAFDGADAVAGVPTTLTYTVTNTPNVAGTSDYASKTDWGFTNTLPQGLVLADNNISSTCGNGALSAGAGTRNVAITGGDLAAGAASCTVTVNVLAASSGTYTNTASTVRTTGLVAPGDAALTVAEPARISIQKNLTGARTVSGDQFKLAIHSGATELTSVTTTGSLTGTQAAKITGFAVQPGQTYTISETVTSSSALNNYETGYECRRAGVVIATGTSVSGDLTVPNEAGVQIDCVFTNTPLAGRMYCDTNYFYAIRDNGALVQASGASGQTTTLVAGTTAIAEANSLGINRDGSAAYAVNRATRTTGGSNGSVESILKYEAQGGTMRRTVISLQTAEGTLARTSGTIVAGAVDPIGGYYVIGKAVANAVQLYGFMEGAAAGSRIVYLGDVSTAGTTSSARNGDIAFDEKGNLHILASASNAVQTYTVASAVLEPIRQGTITGGTFPASSTSNRALNPALTANGIAFTPRGTVYLASDSAAYQYDPMTWTRVPGSAAVTLADSTDLASCSSPASISLEKQVVGRRIATNSANDNFTVSIAPGTSTTTIASAATGTSNSATISPLPVQINTTVTISETMMNGQTNVSSSYRPVYECWADGERIYGGTATSATITIPNRLSVGVACTYFNTPVAAATVKVTKNVLDAQSRNPQPGAGWTVGATVTSSTNGSATTLPDNTTTQKTDASGVATWNVLFSGAATRATVRVSEQQQSDYQFVSGRCNVTGPGGNRTVALTSERVDVASVAPGESVDCTIVNKVKATQLTLIKAVQNGTAAAASWTVSATAPTGALAGPSGTTGTTAVTNVPVTPGVAYQLGETGGDARYVPVGWTCVDANNNNANLPVTSANQLTLPLGANALCTITDATSFVTIVKNVVDARDGFRAPQWTMVATPASGVDGLTAASVVGAEHDANGNPASTIAVRPGHTYTLSERLTDSASTLAYRQLRLERRNTDGTWSAVSSATITAPAAGSTTPTVYRFVNAPVPGMTLPLTGGVGADSYFIAGGVLLALTAGLLLWQRRRRDQKPA